MFRKLVVSVNYELQINKIKVYFIKQLPGMCFIPSCNHFTHLII